MNKIAKLIAKNGKFISKSEFNVLNELQDINPEPKVKTSIQTFEYLNQVWLVYMTFEKSIKIPSNSFTDYDGNLIKRQTYYEFVYEYSHYEKII